MATPSTLPPPGGLDVAVVGRGRGLDAVARTLRSKSFDVTRVKDTKIRLAARHVVIIGDVGTLRKSKWTPTTAGVLALVSGPKVESLVSKSPQGDRWDFVRLVDREEPDAAAMSEIVVRVRRLCAAAPAADSESPPDLAGDLHDPVTGRVDARHVARLLGVSLRELSDAIGEKYTTVHKTPTAKRLQEPLGAIARSVELLRRLGRSEEQIRAWLHAPHGELEERTPWSVIASGRADVVRDMLLGASIGLPT